MTNANWQNLRDNLCPKCGGELEQGMLSDVISCRSGDFTISEGRKTEIETSMSDGRAMREFDHENNLSDI